MTWLAAQAHAMQQSTEHGALAWRTTFIHEGVAAAGPLIACLHGSAVRWLSSHWATFPHQRHARGCYNMLCNAQAKPFHGIGLPAGAHQGWWSSGQDTAIGSPLEDRGQHQRIHSASWGHPRLSPSACDRHLVCALTRACKLQQVSCRCTKRPLPRRAGRCKSAAGYTGLSLLPLCHCPGLVAFQGGAVPSTGTHCNWTSTKSIFPFLAKCSASALPKPASSWYSHLTEAKLSVFADAGIQKGKVFSQCEAALLLPASSHLDRSILSSDINAWRNCRTCHTL